MLIRISIEAEVVGLRIIEYFLMPITRVEGCVLVRRIRALNKT